MPGEILDLFDFESGGKALADWVDPECCGQFPFPTSGGLRNFHWTGEWPEVLVPQKDRGGHFGRVLFEDTFALKGLVSTVQLVSRQQRRSRPCYPRGFCQKLSSYVFSII